MRKPRGRFGRPMKTTEEIIEEFQNELDELEYEEYGGETYDGEPIEEYEEEDPEYEESGEYEKPEEHEEPEEYEEPAEYEELGEYEELEEYEEPAESEEIEEYEELEEYEESEESGEIEEYEELEEYEEPGESEEIEEYEELEEYEEPEESEEIEEYEELEEYEEPAESEETEEYEELEEYEEPTEYEEFEEYEELEEYEEPAESEEIEEYGELEEYEEPAESEEIEEYGELEEYEESAESEEFEEYEEPGMTISSRRKSGRKDADETGDAGDRILDKFILIAGAAVLLMALITGAVFAGMRFSGSQHQSYQEVGAQLADINLIGGQGLASIANARQTYIAMQLAQATPEPVPTQPPESYDEQDYRPDIDVQMNFSSIEKDLKIKFVNKETGKLISNVPFSITITDPDGSTVMWSDDDMDGIIYKKNLTPGQYRLVMNAFADEKYKGYGLVTAEQKTEVKKEIEYKKVDVSDEVKTESQINVAEEDTKINQTIVESYLQDTVAWVESTSTMITYAEVAKSNIPDPMTLAMGGSFVRLSRLISEPSAEFSPDSAGTPATDPPTVDPVVPPTADPVVPPTAAPTDSPTVAPTTEPTAEPTAPPTPAPTAEPTPEPTAAPTPMPVYVGKIDPSSKTLGVGESFAVSAFCEGVTIQSITWSSNNPAAVTVDGNGTVTAVAATQQPALISYVANGVDGAGNAVGGLTASCSVTVTAVKNLKLDKATELVYTGASVYLTATLENGLDTDVLTVESSDTNVAKAEISGRTVTVTGIGAGTANITVKYTENSNTVTAVCTVTVKQNPRENRTSLLKDKDGNELYVQENNNYRPAYYADYYTYDKFFKKGEAKYTGWQTINGAVKYFDINGNAVTGEQVIQGVKYNFASDGALVTGAGIMGIDVSKYNGVIDWNAVKNSGVSYVIIRCGYRGSSLGGLIVDPMFHTNIKGATDAGLKVGVYFFTQAVDRVEAVEEASMVLDLIKNYRISYPVFLDVEASGGRADGISKETRTEVCKAFCQTIQNAGYTAGVYANKTWLTEKLDPSQLGAYKIWLAQYASVPTYNGRYEMWQYKSTGRVSGISGDVDLNLSYLGY